MQVYTIGFTKKGASEFFGLLEDANIERLIDVRLRNRSQLSGFAKRDDLQFFLDRLLDIEYEHAQELAPTKTLLDEWRDDEIDWETYEDRFEDLLAERQVENNLRRDSFEKRTVLLCSEHKPDQCHRRLILDYLDEKWSDIEMIHLT